MLVILSGVSGAGKDTIKKELIKRMEEVESLPSFTSRNPRVGEEEGIQYHFITKEQFEEKIKNNEFYEYDLHHENYYGTSRKLMNDKIQSGKIIVKDIEVNGTENLVKLLKEDKETSDAGINMKEIPLFLCARDNNPEPIYTKIKQLRKKYGFEYSDETIYEMCFEELDASEEDETRFKLKNIMKEMPDDFVRKLRLTGLITIRGYGKFIDFNSTEIEKINYILENYSSYDKYESEYDYYLYMSKIDTKLINIETHTTEGITAESTLEKWVKYFDWKTIKEELQILSNNGKSKDSILKIINGPTRLEFLISIALKKTFENVIVKPNYTVDDEGLPRRHAAGGLPDIECYDQKYNSFFEVTLLTGTQQNIREMPAICRHLREQILKNINSFSVFIAPTLHNDSVEYTKFIKFKDNLDIVPLSINEFIATAEMKSNLEKLILLKSC